LTTRILRSGKCSRRIRAPSAAIPGEHHRPFREQCRKTHFLPRCVLQSEIGRAISGLLRPLVDAARRHRIDACLIRRRALRRRLRGKLAALGFELLLERFRVEWQRGQEGNQNEQCFHWQTVTRIPLPSHSRRESVSSVWS